MAGVGGGPGASGSLGVEGAICHTECRKILANDPLSDDAKKPPAGASLSKTEEHHAVDHAADLPTAVWDEDSLRAAGVELPSPEEGDAPRGAAPPQVQTVPETDAPRPARRELSWPITIGLALVLGGAVYFLVRFLR